MAVRLRASSKLEERLAEHLALMTRSTAWPYPEPVREFHPMWCCEHKKKQHGDGWCLACTEIPTILGMHDFTRARDFRVDFAWPAQGVIVECEGVRFDAQGGRHQTGAGFSADLEKYTALELAGWRVVRVGTRQITSGEALSLIEKALKERSLGT